MTVLLVFLGGAVGAPSRYLLDRYVRAKLAAPFPSGTLVVNLIGCFILGLISAGVAHAGWSPSVQALAGTGFCGGLTTFSTFSVEAVELLQGRRPGASAGYVLASCGFGIAVAALGYAVG
ncbi:MAG TPA: fluoride efflux transporter CrcB [Jatrophihabitans sp.]|jgi:CrcB protein